MLYYIRDNNTFRKVKLSAEDIALVIREEFDRGYTYGMLCSKQISMPCIHATGDLEYFLERCLEWFDSYCKGWEKYKNGN